MGAIIGRHANRIAEGSFKLNDKIIKIDKNRIKSLHGGNNDFKKNWNW